MLSLDAVVFMVFGASVFFAGGSVYWSVVVLVAAIGIFALGVVSYVVRSNAVAFRVALIRSGLLLGVALFLGAYQLSASLMLMPTMLGWPLLARTRPAQGGPRVA